ncbi:hypothetical protein KRR55_10885 [Paeniglutamicibacter sp. ABSL32-1]|uniref:hypothetical protein n=1 Tax=Paeniglutamicibacter quisquiliarum TaxID=2849498 RepID=UPI001C2D884D|nr:hypothetical protein [Paeniglutamicibacter quisquiliarum]MBV1779614.1 hypothetical protein [Paeniglutamicibacter quisquiliarum]
MNNPLRAPGAAAPISLLSARSGTEPEAAGRRQAPAAGADAVRARGGAALNVQTPGPRGKRVRSLARGPAAATAGTAVPGPTETLPAGQDHISWMDSHVRQLEVALGH